MKNLVISPRFISLVGLPRQWACALLFTWSCLSLGAFAQASLPANQTPIKIWVGASAGGTTDTMARAMAQALALQLSRVVLVENKTGAGGNLAADAVAKAPPDGLALLMSFTSHAINASLYPNLPFDPIKDFTPITLVSSSPSILVAHPSVGANNVAELIDLAKKRPGKLNFAIGGVGSSLHLAGDMFKLKSGANIANIPYRGTAPAIQDVLAGQVELMFANIGNAQQYIATGKLKALGVTSPKRLNAFADVPAIAEILPGFESSAWFGLFGPAKLSSELTKRLSEASINAIQTSEVRRRIEAEGATPVGNSPQEFAKFLEIDISRWREVVKFSGAKPE
ncbi:MAG: tripartite tricarboxylate transporter substrate binding protein [Burkholderiaceae bacterium]